MQSCEHYVEALEDERRKIQVFQRELPLCLVLVTQAIERCKQGECFHECSKRTSSDGPVLEEFMPITRNLISNDDEEQSRKPNAIKQEHNSRKSDWLKSVQLWNQTPPDPPNRDESPRKIPAPEVKRNGGGAFHPFKREKSDGSPSSVMTAASSSTAETGGCGGGRGGGSKREEERREGQSHRKPRRCWSQDLHRRFLNALQQLGGPHAATPKQIREFMKVNGLTNDEVKSHLQKYRLNARRPTPPSIQDDKNPQAPRQFVAAGGIWVPPPEYTATAAAAGEVSRVGASSSGRIYASIAAPVPPIAQTAASQTLQRQQQQQQQPKNPEESPCLSKDGGARSCSPSTSSSTHTTTASHSFKVLSCMPQGRVI